MRRALSRSSRIAAISDATRDEIRSLDSAAAERTRVTWLGVGGRFRPASSAEDRNAAVAARRRWLPGAPSYVLTIGQLAPYKNHPAVVRAFAEAFRDRADVHLAMVQRRGVARAELTRLASSLGVGERLHLLRDVPDDELVALYWGALLLCHPSIHEGFGQPPLEAMAAGCPVVTSDRAPMREVSAGAALLVDPERPAAIAAAMRRLVDEPELRDGLRSLGLRRAAELSWRRTAEATLDIYRELL
jgi:glycosyltransferase involved in cell wall biosynthesis